MTRTVESPVTAPFSGQDIARTESSERLLSRTLSAMRRQLGMHAAFVSEFVYDRMVFRHVDAPGLPQAIRAGSSVPLGETYCKKVVDGGLPELIPDTSRHPVARELAATAELPVGAFMGVPVKLRDGRVYGGICCFSSDPDPSLNDRDLRTLRVFAEFVAEQIDYDREIERQQQVISDRINKVLSGDALSMVYQPIYHLASQRIIGLEALARFNTVPMRTPDIWFHEAAQAGLAIPLEAKAIGLAIPGIERLPGNVYVSVNASPDMICHGRLAQVLEGWPFERIMLEITEHAVIERYSAVAEKLAPLRARGLRLAVDDAGAGYASFRHILGLSPDVIKLDMSMTRDIDTDRSRRALASALVGFAAETHSLIVAEGVETASELAELRRLGISKAQGYFLGKPMGLEAAADLFV